ncbi:Uncharacterised protein [Janthinobacterium lividum]|uniref:TOTE conflict system archaeo-eukaryotic primase domain-containing protein n=1 Tax=Janthinobacterium lividum TaxID=29581 RepID=UPI000DFC2D1B|nr:hypothetical protein [Janthinobacterium lividum]STQ92303.1 Uncharacterised protein [Janthinobacterium lividum]
MHKLISELTRLYLFEEQQQYIDAEGGAQPLTPAVLARHLSGEQTVAVQLVSGSGLTRALVLEFGGKGGGEAHWSALCTIANAVQHELDLPAPAVSISGTAFQLWLSLATPVPVAQARQFVQLLRSTFLPASTDILATAPPADVEQAALPPCLQPSGKWAAFIHPSMGAAFVDEPGLDMPPPRPPSWASWKACAASSRDNSRRRWPSCRDMRGWLMPCQLPSPLHCQRW